MNVQPPQTGYRSVYAVSAGIWVSGVLWLLFHYFFVRETEFGPAHHPLEHWCLVAHGAMAFACLWLMGFMWATHIPRRWRLRRHRKTGGVLFGTMALLIVSGFLLYYPPVDEWHAPTAIVHWVIGIAMPFTLLAHWSIRALKSRSRAASPKNAEQGVIVAPILRS
jgi:hypothetical protein